jgi:hypothetical protein
MNVGIYEGPPKAVVANEKQRGAEVFPLATASTASKSFSEACVLGTYPCTPIRRNVSRRLAPPAHG